MSKQTLCIIVRLNVGKDSTKNLNGLFPVGSFAKVQGGDQSEMYATKPNSLKWTLWQLYTSWHQRFRILVSDETMFMIMQNKHQSCLLFRWHITKNYSYQVEPIFQNVSQLISTRRKGATQLKITRVNNRIEEVPIILEMLNCKYSSIEIGYFAKRNQEQLVTNLHHFLPLLPTLTILGLLPHYFNRPSR